MPCTTPALSSRRRDGVLKRPLLRSTTRRIFAPASCEPANQYHCLALFGAAGDCLRRVTTGIYDGGGVNVRDDGAGKTACADSGAAGANPLDAVSFDAAILIEPAENDPQLRALAQAGIPCVTIGRTPGTDTPVPWVELHSAATAQLLLTHLEASGASKCALFVGNTRRTSVLESEAAYQRWCAERRDPVVYSLNESEGENAGYRPRSSYYRHIPTLTACWC